MKNSLALLLVAILLFTCNKKEEDEIAPPPSITLQNIEVSASRITVKGSIVNASQVAIIDHGYLWGLSTPTLESAPSESLGALNGSTNFEGEIPLNLQPNKLYLVRAYYKTKDGVFYSHTKGFKTPDVPPIIAFFAPTTASWGDTVRITGQYFSSKPEDNQIAFGDFNAPCLSATPVELITVVPTKLNTSNVKLSVAVLGKIGLALTNFNLVPPTVTSFLPATGGVGQQITINGKNFRSGFTTAYLGGKQMTISSVTVDKIVGEVPRGLTHGSQELSVCVASQTVVAPNSFSFNGIMISEFLPAFGTYDDIILIKGSGFLPTASANKVTFGNIQAMITEAGPGFMKVAVPYELKTATTKITISNTLGYVTSQSEFQLLPPEIISISPTKPSFGERITIVGKNFNPSRRNNVVKINTTSVTLDEVTNTTISFSLWDSYWAPDGTSKLSLTIGEHNVQAPFDFEIRTPVISSFTPQTGVRSDVVIVHGENFHPSPGLDTVYVGNAVTTATSASKNMLTFKVPKGVTGGNHIIKIKVGGKFVTQGTFSVVDSWSAKANVGGGPRVRGIAFTIDSYAYVGGGSSTTGSTLSNDFYQYDPTLDQWTKKANLPVNNQAMTAFSTVSYGYIIYHKQLWRYDPVANTWTQKANFPGIGDYRQSAFSVNNKAYIGLGMNQWGTGRTSELYEYIESTDQWTSKASFPPGAAEGFASFTASGKGYVAMSWSNASDLWEYDPGTDTWTKKMSLSGVVSDLTFEGRTGAVAISTPSKGYFGTGTAGSSYSRFKSDLYEYDPATNKVVRLIDVPGEGRTAAFGFSLNDKIYLGGGITSLPWGSYSAMDDFYECDPAIKF